jgi:hypothetical protein
MKDFCCKRSTCIYNMHRCLLSDDGSLGLAMSRAFGDFCLIDYGLNAAPNVFYRKKLSCHDGGVF